MKITFLGTGTSQGVPVITCECKVCSSTDERDKRLRTSIMIQEGDLNIVVDTGPDFRAQMLRTDIKHLDAVLYTHEHKDHIAGLDDVRPFNYIQKKATEIFCTDRVEEALRRDFHYCFSDNKYPGIPQLNLNIIDFKSFYVKGLKVIPIEVLHYKLPVLGFRIGDFTYITDAKTIAEKERKKIRGSKVLVINALRFEEHISHFNFEEALEMIKDLEVETAYLTHISHLMTTHEELIKLCPANVIPAFDGLKIEI